jgi:glutathione S-transferase
MASPTLILCDFPVTPDEEGYESFSPFVMKAARALLLAGLAYEHRRLGITEVRSKTPVGQLPVLLVGDEVVGDSTAILRKIEELAPGSLTGGLDPRALAEAWLWEEFADTSLYPFVLATRWADDRGWPVPRAAFFGGLPVPLRQIVAGYVRRGTVNKLVERDFLRGGLDQCYARLRDVLANLDARAPDAGFWLGERPSVADISLFAQLESLRYPRTPFQAEVVNSHRRLAAYLDRVGKATGKSAKRKTA